MNSLFTFLIQSSVAMLLFYMVYWFFLRKETLYISNRFFLLFALLTSVAMPLMSIQYMVVVEGGSASGNFLTEVIDAFKGAQPYANTGFEATSSVNWLNIFLVIYLTGAAIFMFRLLVQTAILVIQIIKNKIKLLDGLRIIETEKYGLPFSFFNFVYINPKFHKQDVLPEILAHEKVHIRERHWADLLIIELLTVIFWFNPIIWFFEHAIKLNHEYLADHGVISNGSHVGKYQALLVNQLMGMQIIGLTNNLNFGINTNRLKMMTKQKTPKIKAIKLAWAMPVLALLLYAFAEPNYKVIQADGGNYVSDFQEKEVGKLTEISGTITNPEGEAIPGVSVLVVGTTIGSTTDLDGAFKLKVPIDNAMIEFSYIGKETLRYTLEDIFFKNNEIVMKDVAIYLDLDQISDHGIPPPPPPKGVEKGNIPPPPPPKRLDNGEKEVNKVGTIPPPVIPNKTSDVEEMHIFFVVEQMPEYPGGFKALKNHILNMQQRLAEKDVKVKGKVKVGFTIDENGKPTNVRIIEKDYENAASLAASIIYSMETWSPGKQRNKPVPIDFILPLEFK